MKMIFSTELCCLGGQMTQAKSQTVPLTLFDVSLQIFPLCWNFSGNRDFHKGSFIHEWSPKTVFSRERLSPSL